MTGFCRLKREASVSKALFDLQPEVEAGATLTPGERLCLERAGWLPGGPMAVSTRERLSLGPGHADGGLELGEAQTRTRCGSFGEIAGALPRSALSLRLIQLFQSLSPPSPGQPPVLH